MWRATAVHGDTSFTAMLGTGGDWQDAGRGAGTAPAALQIALQCLRLVRRGPGRWALQRRLRVSTRAWPGSELALSADPPSEFEAAFAPAPCLALLTQRSLAALAADAPLSVAAGLADRLLGVLKRLRALDLRAASAALPPGLRALLRGAHALLHLLVAVHRDEGRDDALAARLRLLGGLAPRDLAAALYPALSSWQTPDRRAFASHTLSKVRLGGRVWGGIASSLVALKRLPKGGGVFYLIAYQ